MRIGITGSSSPIGRLIVENFRNEFEIIELGRGSLVKWKLGERAPKGINLDKLIHLAHDRTEKLNVSVLNNKMLFEQFGKDLIFLSSTSGFEGSKSIYGRIKHESEKICLENDGIFIKSGLIITNPLTSVTKQIAKLGKFGIVPLPERDKSKFFVTEAKSLIAEIRLSLFMSNGKVGIRGFNSNPHPLSEIIEYFSRRKIVKLKIPSLKPILENYVSPLDKPPKFFDSYLSLIGADSITEDKSLSIPKIDFPDLRQIII